MEAPPFDVALMLGKEFGSREGWQDVLKDANALVKELDSILVRAPGLCLKLNCVDNIRRSLEELAAQSTLPPNLDGQDEPGHCWLSACFSSHVNYDIRALLLHARVAFSLQKHICLKRCVIVSVARHCLYRAGGAYLCEK